MLLTLAAANGIAWLMRSIVIPGQWLGHGEERFRLGPGVWAAMLAGLIAVPHVQWMTTYHGSFAAYRDAGTWIAQTKANDHGKVLDMTDWSLFFSGQPGFKFSEVHWAAIDPNTRWVVVRDAHLRGRWNFGPVVRKLIAGRDPILTIPAKPKPHEVQILIYDRRGPLRPEVAQQAAKAESPTPPRRDGNPSPNNPFASVLSQAPGVGLFGSVVTPENVATAFGKWGRTVVKEDTDRCGSLGLPTAIPCVGGAENYGRAIVRRFVASGDSVDVLTSDAHDLWYFTDQRRRRVDEPSETEVDGAKVRRFAVRASSASALRGSAPELHPPLAHAMPGRSHSCQSCRASSAFEATMTRFSRWGSPTPSFPTPRS